MSRRRWWVSADLAGRSLVDDAKIRATSPIDDDALVGLLERAYAGTIDDDPSHSFSKELRIWRRVDGADDHASRVAIDERGGLVAACLIGREFGLPLLYEIVTDPTAKQRGLARAVLAASTHVLQAAGYRALLAWVTDGNVACERLLTTAGFVSATAPLNEAEARDLYGEIAAADPLDLVAWLLDRDRSP